MRKKPLLQELSESPGHSSMPVMHTLTWIEKGNKMHTRIIAQTAFEAWQATYQVHRCPFHLVEFSI